MAQTTSEAQTLPDFYVSPHPPEDPVERKPQPPQRLTPAVHSAAQPPWCPNATTAVEKLICATPELSTADIKMNLDVVTALKRTSSAADLTRRRKVWFANRNACGKLVPQIRAVKCIADSYRAWDDELENRP